MWQTVKIHSQCLMVSSVKNVYRRTCIDQHESVHERTSRSSTNLRSATTHHHCRLKLVVLEDSQDYNRTTVYENDQECNSRKEEVK